MVSYSYPVGSQTDDNLYGHDSRPDGARRGPKPRQLIEKRLFSVNSEVKLWTIAQKPVGP